MVRRLHDADRSGWLSLLTVLPYIGFVFQIAFALLSSKPHGERFDQSAATASDEGSAGLNEAAVTPTSADSAPGWDAIDAAFARLYPGIDGAAPHFGRTDARLPGDGIWGITAHPNTSAAQPHWHLVTYGFSNVFDSDPTSDEHDTWADFEWTFRVAADIDLTEPLAPQVPTWAVLLLQRLGDLVFSGRDALDVPRSIPDSASCALCSWWALPPTPSLPHNHWATAWTAHITCSRRWPGLIRCSSRTSDAGVT
ncbi:suppressor of fused domain protein [Mycobacterium sp. DL440]|uniref:suppressor of fused domain protein n=1 Tax=Mycobacterium sp. DL440 TaxID=2675523 RepID=UPI001FB9317A|nr:suppressor of fused domain protein [Mycobacterium sp. DL440]